ncbi:hypothetical protein PWG71_17410 [Nocardiopsis sp. N85]|uniref:hypothetical protein n=1 Tax=Nocardiopsis sp. N85 TaxID=3029400 RepID=UPI00237F7FA3|nr:hypothetical protein [Nocardiopsis sp. N85]MDE3723173.1 hypothetical protein [Nocardiopsis sp. N85]
MAELLSNMNSLLTGGASTLTAILSNLFFAGFAAFVAIRGKKYLTSKVKKSDHSLHEINSEALVQIEEIARQINSEVWNRQEFPLTEQNLRQEGDSITLEAGTNLLILERQLALVEDRVKDLQSAGATNQSFEEMMHPDSTLVINPVAQGSRTLSQDEATRTAQSIGAVRDNLVQVDMSLKESYKILGFDLNVSARDAIKEGKLPDFRQWVDAILEDYPKVVTDLVKNNGLAAAHAALALVKETGHSPLSGQARKEAVAEIIDERRRDVSAREARGLPPAESNPLDILSKPSRKDRAKDSTAALGTSLSSAVRRARSRIGGGNGGNRGRS